ncbi:Polysaccharide pyruvyl transferase [Anatilimnocola aggregata]|uniref:Polysaccharide pyruvyl transferase n=1 Tax=Anatilimnocola aggregata TaxID=2528021 RepID=A0A517Y7N8_9BACT|nr:polysaccharide pyruvyl transferase family protein [Anatilimnocola aggregata]QDU26227.1 Polysaccharide pyruvyl transferase [Anatilimnocola aggregata]
MIKMYWWQGGGGTGNFGDKLAPALVQALTGKQVTYSPIDKADIVAIGSVLEPWFWPQDSWLTYAGYIWGAGRMFGNIAMPFPRANIVGVRGELTLNTLGDVGTQDTVVGDPGLLCGHLHRSEAKVKYKLGIWPHWSEAKHPKLSALLNSSPEILLINPCGDIRATIDQAASCEAIAATSLHGLVIADALAVPNCWLRLGTGKEDNVGMPLFKYFDYFSAFQAPPPAPHILSTDATLDELLPKVNSRRHADVARLQDDLLSAFPLQRSQQFV